MNNRLNLNDEKTHLLVMTNSKDRRRLGPNNLVSITTPTEVIKPTKCEKLGGFVHQDEKWNEHLQDIIKV